MMLTRALGTEHLLARAVRVDSQNTGKCCPELTCLYPRTAHLVQGAHGLEPDERSQELNLVEARSLRRGL